MLHPKIYSKLLCPVSHQPLTYQQGTDLNHAVLVCETTQVVYPIENGIPLLLQEKSFPLSDLAQYWISTATNGSIHN
jgi:uncharacterized protein YbaR (Trm112 family)